MQVKIDKTGPVGGEFGDIYALLYTIAKAVFGADANGVVTIGDDLTAAPFAKAHATVVASMADAP